MGSMWKNGNKIILLSNKITVWINNKAISQQIVIKKIPRSRINPQQYILAPPIKFDYRVIVLWITIKWITINQYNALLDHIFLILRAIRMIQDEIHLFIKTEQNKIKKSKAQLSWVFCFIQTIQLDFTNLIDSCKDYCPTLSRIAVTNLDQLTKAVFNKLKIIIIL